MGKPSNLFQVIEELREIANEPYQSNKDRCQAIGEVFENLMEDIGCFSCSHVIVGPRSWDDGLPIYLECGHPDHRLQHDTSKFMVSCQDCSWKGKEEEHKGIKACPECKSEYLWLDSSEVDWFPKVDEDEGLCGDWELDPRLEE